MFQTFFCKKFILSARLSVAFIFLSFLIGCSQGESRVESGNRLGILHFGSGSEAQTVDPHVGTGLASGYLMSAIYEGLVVSNPYTLEPEPGAAESWTISEDKLTYRFTLRDNALWSNGDPVTAHDFLWTYKRSLNPKMGNEYAYMLFTVVNAEKFSSGEITDFDQVGFKAIDDRTFEIKLRNPTPYFLQLLAHTSSSPVHRGTIEKHGSITARYSPWTRPENIVGNGPFTLADWKINQAIIVEKNPSYWDSERVALNEIHFYPTEVIKTEELLFRSGQLHRTYEMPYTKINEYRKNNPDALRINTYLGTYYYQINMTRKPFDDVRVRQALAMSIDRDSLIDAVFYGVNLAGYTMTPPGTLGYQPPKVFNYDPEKARNLLADAGFANGEKFPTFEILYNNSESHRKVAVAIQQMWKANLNINVTLTNQEWKVYLDSRDEMNYDIARAGWIGDYVDPLTFLDIGLSTNGNNTTGFKDDHYDYLITEYIPQAKTPEERLARFAEAEKYLIEAMPFIPIYTYETKYLLDPGVKGMPVNLRDDYNFRYVSVGNSKEETP